MNTHRLAFVGRVSLLCLVAGSLPWGAMPAVAETTDAPSLQQPEELPSAQGGLTPKLHSTEPTTNSTGGTVALSNTDAIPQNSTLLSQGQQVKSSNSAVAPISLPNTASQETRSSASVIDSSTQPLDSRILAQLTQSSTPDSSAMEQVNSVSELGESSTPDSSPMEQVTSVTQLSDVRPNDWAFEALRSLVERYGCIAGYPDGTFRGNRAMSRYEFAAGLNACLQQIERLIAANTADFATKQDLATLQRLVDEFRPELASLGTRVDTLEGRVAVLEDRQFSTTTKLNGEVIFSLVGGTGGDKDDSDGFRGRDPNPILVNRVRLNLNTSFTGKDMLITGLQANNFGGDLLGNGSVQGSFFPGPASFLSEGMTKLSFEPEFPRFNPQDLSASSSNSVQLYKLLYIFPSGIKNLTLFAGTAAEASDAFPTIIPFSSEGQGAISRFATLNPVLRVSGGTSQTGLASAAGFIWTPSPKFDLRALYGSVNAALPGEGATNILGSGVFNGSYVAAAQLTLKPTNSIDVGINYAHSYHDLNILGLGLSRFSSTPLNIPGRTVNADGTLNLDGVLNTPVNVNSVGATVAWRFTPKITLTGYGAYFFVDSAAGPDSSSNFSSWMAGLYFQDLLKEGNTAGLLFGQPLYRVDAGGAARLTEPGADRATPYHLEAFYNVKVSDNVSVTPGAFLLFNPEGDANNDTTLVGVLRTTFTF